jgi:hypothetical protein
MARPRLYPPASGHSQVQAGKAEGKENFSALRKEENAARAGSI